MPTHGPQPPPLVGALEGEVSARIEMGTPGPPTESSWRYRTTGAPKVLAQIGIMLGFLALVLPGVLATRSYRRWQAGIQATPAAAWRAAILLIYLPLAFGLFTLVRPADVSVVAVSLVVIPVVLLSFGHI